MMLNISDRQGAERLLRALAGQLAVLGESYDLVVVGGSGLLALELSSRPTGDVDLVGLVIDGRLRSADPLPPPLRIARDRVARDFDLPTDWLNGGPSALLDFGLPAGFLSRTVRLELGPALTVLWASRLDQIHLKLYAMVDQGPGKHEADLRALDPTPDELRAAAAWSRFQDPSEGYLSVLQQALASLGVDYEPDRA